MTHRPRTAQPKDTQAPLNYDRAALHQFIDHMYRYSPCLHSRVVTNQYRWAGTLIVRPQNLSNSDGSEVGRAHSSVYYDRDI